MKRILWRVMSIPWLVRLGTSSPRLYERAIADFERAVLMPGAAIFIGSSSLRFWATLANDLAPTAVVNFGFGGAHASHVRQFWRRVVPRQQPKIVAFYAGDNDLAAGKSVAQTFADIAAFVDDVRALLPATRVLLLLVKHSPQRLGISAAIDALNTRIRTLARPGVEVIDVDTPLQGADGLPREELFRFDGLHLSAAGYKLWTRAVKPALEQ